MIYKETQSQKSLLDFLMYIMPDMKDVKFMIFQKPTVDKQSVKKLMSLWKEEDKSDGFRRFKRPEDMTLSDIELLEKEQLVRAVGSGEVEITSKGVDIIKTMILGDERSVYENNGKHLDYEVALANTKPKRKMIKGAKRASKEIDNSSNWYRKIKKWD